MLALEEGRRVYSILLVKTIFDYTVDFKILCKGRVVNLLTCELELVQPSTSSIEVKLMTGD